MPSAGSLAQQTANNRQAEQQAIELEPVGGAREQVARDQARRQGADKHPRRARADHRAERH